MKGRGKKWISLYWARIFHWSIMKIHQATFKGNQCLRFITWNWMQPNWFTWHSLRMFMFLRGWRSMLLVLEVIVLTVLKTNDNIWRCVHLFSSYVPFLSFSQSCTVQILATWNTPPGLCPTRNSWWGQQFSTAATPASSCRAAPPLPATAVSPGPPCGRLASLTVSVSVGRPDRKS